MNLYPAAIRTMLTDSALFSVLTKSRKLPIKALAAASGVSRKTLDRYRKYIVMAVLITDEDGEALLAEIDVRELRHHRIDAAVAATAELMDQPASTDPPGYGLRIRADTGNERHSDRLRQELEPVVERNRPAPSDADPAPNTEDAFRGESQPQPGQEQTPPQEETPTHSDRPADDDRGRDHGHERDRDVADHHHNADAGLAEGGIAQEQPEDRDAEDEDAPFRRYGCPVSGSCGTPAASRRIFS